MADTDVTMHLSELAVPTIVLMLNDDIDPKETISLYGDIYEYAKYYEINMEQGDRTWWKNRKNEAFDDKAYEILYRSILTAQYIFQYIYNGHLPKATAEIIGRNNTNFPPDFRIGDDLFSLKDNSNILWNTTPKALLQYINPEIYDAIQNGDIDYYDFGIPLDTPMTYRT